MSSLCHAVRSAVGALAVAAVLASASGVFAAQEQLKPVLNAGDRLLRFDWPAIEIGVGEYEEGPTGVTVFHFPRRARAAVDVRGGAPGTVNTDYLRLGYDARELDAVVFAGGSWYGLEDTTAVATALKDDGVRSGVDVALAVGAIIYDFGGRRLNEIYPDKRLAQAALRAARPGVFPLGGQGAGRFAMTGSYFGCNAHSGQGGAFRQVGDVKIAAFVVVNALGAVTRRDGRVAACYPGAAWPTPLRTADLMAGLPGSRDAKWSGQGAATDQGPGARNTTISLVVTNQKLAPSELQRLAVQVHSSMGRAIQPFATVDDGDALYAVSTGEVDPAKGGHGLDTVDLGALAGETMWDAILSSVPDQPAPPSAAPGPAPTADHLATLAGDYVFSPFVSVRITAREGRLYAQATGRRAAYAIGRDKAIALEPAADGAFTAPGRYPLVLKFEGDALVINPGHWAQTGLRARP
jgi:L-aminopeptidase/D-esterase-like protein